MDEEYYSYIRKFFRRLASIYAIADLFVFWLRDKVVDFIDARSGSRVLDVATGTGKQAFAFAKRSYNVVGLDLSKDMLRLANNNNKYENAEFAVADATNMPFDKVSFDVSCASFALHDMPFVIREKVLNEMVRVTDPQGIIVIVDYGLLETRILRRVFYHFVRLYESKYCQGFIKCGLNALLKKSGIEIKGKAAVLGGAVVILKGQIEGVK